MRAGIGGGALAVCVAVVLLASIGGVARAASAQELEVRLLFSAPGYSPEQPFQRPAAVVLSEANRVVYVADPGDHKVVVLSLQGVPGFTIEVAKQFDPVSMAVGPGGRLFVADRAAAAIRVFSSAGKIELEIRLAEFGEGRPI